MKISNYNWLKLRATAEKLESEELKNLIEHVENLNTEEALKNKYKEKIDLVVHNLQTKTDHNILCYKVTDHLAIGKCVSSSNYTVYHTPTKYTLGIYGRRSVITDFADKLRALNLDWSTHEKALANGNDENFMELIYEARKK